MPETVPRQPLPASRTTGFFTDSTLCIGCKACEVACKEWNGVPDDGFVWSGLSYDNTIALGHSTWRHVKFVERQPETGAGGNAPGLVTWAFSSDVCKHCANAGCLEACPTGSIVRTEFGSVYVQPDICNGCAYCVIACPFGVVERNQDDGRAFKCTFCYDRQKAGLVPACAKACPTESIKFGEIENLRLKAQERVDELHQRGMKGRTQEGSSTGASITAQQACNTAARARAYSASAAGRSAAASAPGRATCSPAPSTCTPTPAC